MWKKEDAFPQPEPPVGSPNPVGQLRERATIGSSIKIKGDLSGDEDLTVQGQVDGKIDLKQNNVTIGKNGRVKADIYAKMISIEGEVQGNLFGDEKVVIRQSGNVRGNISAPRVSLEDGARFKGSIDMDSRSQEKPGSLSGVFSKSSSSESKSEDSKTTGQTTQTTSGSKTERSTARA